jgi:flavodoxin
METEIIYFSATGTTRALVKAISQELNGDMHFTDITLPVNRKNVIILDSDLTIIAAPVYGLRIPNFLYDFIQQIKGNGNLLAAVAVYGNMSFGISLEQFKNFAKNNNFRLIAAGAFIGQHTYAAKTAPVAYGRPDEHDLQQAHIFGENIQKKIDMKNFEPITLPKNVLPKFIAKFPDSGTRILI